MVPDFFPFSTTRKVMKLKGMNYKFMLYFLKISRVLSIF